MKKFGLIFPAPRVMKPDGEFFFSKVDLYAMKAFKFRVDEEEENCCLMFLKLQKRDSIAQQSNPL